MAAMGAVLDTRPARPELGELRRILESRFGAGASGPFDCLALMEGGLAAADGMHAVREPHSWTSIHTVAYKLKCLA
jgi:hypothetical protein